MMTIYHNPRCRKSREGLRYLESKGVEFHIVKYLETPLDKGELTELIAKLGIEPIELVRTKEAVWKEHFKGKNLTREQVIEAMAQYPKLMERPVVVNGDKAVLARPAGRIEEIL